MKSIPFRLMKKQLDPVVYGTATVGAKGQVVIPAKVRKEMGIGSGDNLIFVGSPIKGAVNVLKAETASALKDLLEMLLESQKMVMSADKKANLLKQEPKE